MVFGASWCKYCPQLYPIIEELREKGYIALYISTDNHPDATDQFKLQSLPTTIIMADGKEKHRIKGVTSARKISKHLKTRKQQGL